LIQPLQTQQRDLYKYIHDQTLRMANHGLNATEIAEVLRLPPTLEAEWHTRSYYGTLSHNAKAVYQRYLGWFDGNPANLHKHPPEAAGRRYVAAMGGAERLLGQAREAFAAGDYRWVAELVGHLVFADPANLEARALQADAFEQMGFQAESGPWRDFYLTGAQELRYPRPPSATPRQASAGQLRTMPTDNVLDSLSVRLNGEKAGATEIEFTAVFTDTGERFAVSVENAVLHHRPGAGGPQVELTRDLLVDLVHGAKVPDEVALEGPGAGALVSLLALLDRFDLWFEISAP
jgi:alkyl sulfatase BDS1-like metallo-beta-lactamase superfamily hydrolase